MFREMRRKKQALSMTECEKVLMNGTSGVLAVLGDEGYPYAVPLSYIYHQNKIYFHSAIEGHKLDALKTSDKVSFCVIDQDLIAAEKFTTYYRSVIAFGKAHVIDNPGEKREALKILGMKYSSDFADKMDEAIKESFDRVAMIVLEIEHLSGKESIDLAKKRQE
jgi:nitroimidazol reductase NimA-like FMN-containing flavoprotein (pyridoxamine 5'-phosphate oxidase superfamily)